MDQPFYQSNFLLNSVENPTFADYLLSPNEANMDFMGMTPQGTDVLGIWDSRDPEENNDDTEMAHSRNTALSINSGGSTRMEERCCERTNILSLENVELNLNDTPFDEGQALIRSSNPSHISQSAEHNNVEASLCIEPDLFESERVPYSYSNGSSSSGVGKGLEHYDRARNSVDVRRTAFKRKNMEGAIGESSSSRSIAGDLSIPNSSRYLLAGCSSGENQGSSFSSMHEGDSSECYLSSSLTGNNETSLRNLPVKHNLEGQHDVSSTQTHSSSTWSPGEPSSVPNSYTHSAEQIQPHMLPVPGLPHRVHSPASSRIGSSSIPAFIQRRMRLIASHEANVRSLPRNSVAEHSTILARTSLNQLVQDLPNWSSSSSNLNMSGTRVGTSSGVIPLPGSIRESSEMVPVQYPRNLADVARLFPSGGPESGRQSSSLSSRRPGCYGSTQEPGQSSRAVRQGHSLLHPRTALSTDRQRSFSASPLPARSRDARSRMISEVR